MTERHRSVELGLLVIALLLGCEHESVCDAAADELEACGRSGQLKAQPPYSFPLTVSRDDCGGENECVARCLEPASCAAIDCVMGGVNSTDPNALPVPGCGKLYGCITACFE